MLAIAVRGKAAGDAEIRVAAGDHEQNTGSSDGARHLRHDVRQKGRRRKAAACPQPDRHSRIEMAAGDRSQRISASEHRQPECERNTGQPDADVRKSGREHGAAATAENEPERPDELRRKLRKHGAPLLGVISLGRAEYYACALTVAIAATGAGATSALRSVTQSPFD